MNLMTSIWRRKERGEKRLNQDQLADELLNGIHTRSPPAQHNELTGSRTALALAPAACITHQQHQHDHDRSPSPFSLDRVSPSNLCGDCIPFLLLLSTSSMSHLCIQTTTNSHIDSPHVPPLSHFWSRFFFQYSSETRLRAK